MALSEMARLRGSHALRLRRDETNCGRALLALYSVVLPTKATISGSRPIGYMKVAVGRIPILG